MKLNQKLAGLFAVASSAATSLAFALPAEIATATAEAKTDVTEAGGMIVGVVVAIAVIAWIRKVIH